MRQHLDKLTMPILLINRYDDVLSPEPKTHWLSKQLPNCAGYHLIEGGERFFLYSRAEVVTPLIEQFLV
jgi:pimeloyl-ACP methyl ester carboxylesterase